MPTKMKIEGADKVILKLQTQARLAKGFNGQVGVGYAAPYAVFVHENLQAYHPNGQAKFLETAARENRRAVADMIRADLLKKIPIQKALYRAALLIKRESQKLCPVKTGFLRNSAYVESTFQDYAVTWKPGKK